MSVQFLIRERTPLPLMLYGVYVYLCSNSLRRASRILEPLVERSHEAIRQWVQRLAPICDRLDVDRRLVRTIFVDETMIRIKGRQAWVWVAYEPTLRAFIGFRVSYNQSILDAYLFLKEVRRRYGRRPIWTDEGLIISIWGVQVVKKVLGILEVFYFPCPTFLSAPPQPLLSRLIQHEVDLVRYFLLGKPLPHRFFHEFD